MAMRAEEVQWVRAYASPQYLCAGKAIDRLISMRKSNVQSIRAWFAMAVRLEVVGLQFMARNVRQRALRWDFVD